MARIFVAVCIAIALFFGVGDNAKAELPVLSQPNWSGLTTEQRNVLSPLANDWSTMENFQRKKWLGIAQRYPAMSPDEQARVQQRMGEWAKLSPEQRRLARDNYRSLKQLAPDHKDAIKQKWGEYSQLPDADKAKLQADALRKPIAKPAPTSGSPSRPLQQTGRPLSPLLAPVLAKPPAPTAGSSPNEPATP